MKAYIYVKHQPHPDLDSDGAQEGDIIQVYPINAPHGKLELDYFTLVTADLNIPCGQGEVPGMTFEMIGMGPGFDHNTCPFNNIDGCDVIKYTSADWDAGDIDNPPKIKRKRKYKLDISKFFNSEQRAGLKKKNKTEKEKDDAYLLMASKEQVKTVINEKQKLTGIT